MKSTTVCPVDVNIALRVGAIDAELTKAGNRIDLGDLIIACTALEMNFAVATDNLRHFERVPGLRLLKLA